MNNPGKGSQESEAIKMHRSPGNRYQPKSVESVFFSSMLEIRAHVAIPPGFKYGLASFTQGKSIDLCNNHLRVQFLGQSLSAEDLPSERGTVFFYSIRGCWEADQVFLVRPLKRRPAILSISGVQAGLPSVHFNREYAMWSNLRFSKVWTPTKHLESVLEASLIQRSITPFHGASIIDKGYVHVLTAPPDTGKSTSVTTLIDHGYDYASEDMILYQNGKVYPLPFTATLEKREKLPLHQRLVNAVFSISTEKCTIYQHLDYPYRPLKPHYQLGNLYLLKLSQENTVTQVSRSSILRRVLMLNRMELRYHQDKVLMALLTLNTSLLSLDDLMAQERQGVEGLVHEAASVFVVEASDPKFFARLILTTL